MADGRQPFAPYAAVGASTDVSHGNWRLGRGFLLGEAAAVLTYTGLCIAIFVISVSVLRSTTDHRILSALNAATYLPLLAITLPSGALAARFNQQKMLISAILAVAVFLALSSAIFIGGRPSVSALLLILAIFILACTGAVLASIWEITGPERAPDSAMLAAVAVVAAGFNIARMAGPLLGQGSLWLFGAWLTILLAAALALIAALLVGMAGSCSYNATSGRSPGPETQVNSSVSNRGAWTGGLRTFTLVASGSAISALLPSIAQGHFGDEASAGFGALSSSLAGGAIVGTIMTLLVPSKVHSLSRQLPAVLGVCMALLSFRAPLAIASCCSLLAGAAWFIIIAQLNLKSRAYGTRSLRARSVSRFVFVFSSGMTAGSVAWGFLASFLGLTSTLLLAALCVCLAAYMAADPGIARADITIASGMKTPDKPSP
ncbi:MFS transporter [Rhizobium mongolense]